FKEVVELHKNQFFEILPDFKVMCEHFEEGDSWICFKTPEQTILNVNDCGIANKSDLDAILAKTGPIDVLMTQFSYAFWAGNPDEVELRQQMADDKLKLVKSQIDALHPKVTIPMASFVYFCHKDNRYLNDRINTAEKTYNFIKENTTSEPVVLYNNEEYEFPEKHDSNASINKYKADLQKILADDTAFITKYETVDKPVLNSEASRFIDDLNKTNSLPLKSALKPTYIYIPDYDETYVLSLKGFKPVTEPHPVPDVELSSELLFWCFKYPFGLDTVQIGGRFRKPRKGNYTAFYNFFRINHLKMRGIDPNAPGTIAGVLVRKITTKIGLNKNR
ncbi:MAG TPA: hypothetical protein VG603_04240, partial [Chitinophagales bacterium]|nr:hypothetical protein [Chitinophagales bacterium]